MDACLHSNAIVQLVHTEESMRKPKNDRIPNMCFSQLMHLEMYTAKVLVPDTVTERRRTVYMGHNNGDALGWIQALNVQDLWVLPRSDKEKVLGAHALDTHRG